eukprot:1161127-Pelagomonas_calceolata.AAC.19
MQVAFLGEQGMDSGGVTREWFSALSSAISRGSPELFCPAGRGVQTHTHTHTCTRARSSALQVGCCQQTKRHG